MSKAKVKASLAEMMGMNQTLVSLASEAAELSKLLIESNGELSPELEKRLEVNSQLLLQKADSYNFIIEQFEAQAALWKRRKDACSAIERRFKSQIDKLWDRIKLAMKEMDKTEIKGNLYRFQLSRSKPRLVIQDESQIPEQFKMIVQSTVIDREKIESALTNGFEVPGVTLEESGTLRVYENSDEE